MVDRLQGPHGGKVTHEKVAALLQRKGDEEHVGGWRGFPRMSRKRRARCEEWDRGLRAETTESSHFPG